MSPGETTDSLVETVTRRIARRFTRRSFIGQVGRGSVALTVGGAVAALEAAPALGNHGNAFCEGTTSITCGNLYGINNCQAVGGCTCGYWIASGGICAPQNTLWADCCGGCNGGADCRCISSGGVWRPTCCNSKAYSGGCGVSPDSHIRCRVYNCTNQNPGGC